jgi:putative ABC transport system permease protein
MRVAAAPRTILRLVNLRELRRQRRRAVLTLLGIAGSVALVVAMMVIHATLDRAIDTTTAGVVPTSGLAVTPRGAAGLPDATTAAIRQVPGAGTVIPMIRQRSLMRRAGASQRVIVLGLPPRGLRLLAKALPALKRDLGPGRPAGLILSEPLAAKLAARRGDAVAVDTPTGRVPVPVSDVLAAHTGASINGGVFALLSLSAAQRVFGRPGRADVVYVYPSPGASQADIRRQLQRVVGATAVVARPGAEATPYKRTFDAIARTTQVVEILAMLVAVLLVFNTLMMSVAERRTEIALIGLTGGRVRHVVAAFLLEAALLGVVGGAAGTALGLVLARAGIDRVQDVYASVLPITSVGTAVLTTPQILIGVGAGAVVAVAGAALAARRVLAIRPIDALRPAPSYASAAPALIRSRWLGVSGAATIALALFIASRVPAGLHASWTAVLLALALGGVAQLLPSIVRVTTTAASGALRPFGVVGRMAGDGLTRVPGRTVVTVGALTVAMAVTVATAIGMHSFEQEARRVTANWNSAPLYLKGIGAGPLISDQPMRASLAPGLERVPGVRAVYPMRFVLLGERRHVAILAMPIVAAARRGDTLTRDIPPAQRSLVAALARGDVVISRLMARRRGLAPGEELTLPTAQGRRAFRVAGLFNDINSDDSLYMDLTTFQQVMNDHEADRFAIMPARGTEATALVTVTRRFATDNRLSGTVVTGQQLTDLVVDTVRGLFSFAGVALLAAAAIAALTITNTMLTTTFERRREFGVQRLLGMGSVQLAGSVLFEAAVLAGIAGLAGIGLGLLLGLVTTMLIESQLAWHIALRPDAAIVLATLFGAPVLGALAAGYPSWRSTRPALTAQLREE